MSEDPTADDSCPQREDCLDAPASDHMVCQEHPYGTEQDPCSLPPATATTVSVVVAPAVSTPSPTLAYTGIETYLVLIAVVLIAVGTTLVAKARHG